MGRTGLRCRDGPSSASARASNSSFGTAWSRPGAALTRMRGLVGTKRVHAASVRANTSRALSRAAPAAAAGATTWRTTWVFIASKADVCRAAAVTRTSS